MESKCSEPVLDEAIPYLLDLTRPIYEPPFQT